MAECRPFLKWVGGKTKLIPELMAQVNRLGSFNGYHEPFVGGGALFFQLCEQKLLANYTFLSDVNPRLAEAYQGVANHVDDVIECLRVHASLHSVEHFYAVRGTLPANVSESAARLIYLNRTCFNGLYRENRKGEFNVPIGRYTNPTICNEPILRAASSALSATTISAQPFEAVLDVAQPGDLVYFDPPYVPVSKTSSFTGYAKNGFSMDDQSRLANTFADLASRGVHVMLSNSHTDAVMSLYDRFNITTVLASRAVNSKAAGRGKVEEVIVTSF